MAPKSPLPHNLRVGSAVVASLVVALLTAVLSAVVTVRPVASATENVIVSPVEHFDLMPSPGSGFQDFVARVPTDSQLATCSYDTTVDRAGLTGGSLYVRLLWRDLEPTEDQYAWPLLDRLFECAEQRGQTIDFRIMVSWPGAGDTDCWNDPSENDALDHSIPCWLVQKGVRELEHDGVGGIPATYVPDWEDPILRADHAELVRAIGARYANNPRLSSVDVGSVGFWGEWHTYPNDAQLMPSNDRRKEIIDLYATAFPDTPLVMLAQIFKNQINGDAEIADHLYQNYSGRFGWRGDSWGGSGHHINDYELIHAANPNLWKTGPVAMEVTGVMNEWPERFGADGYSRVLPIDTVVGDAMDWHASLAHNKASDIPPSFIDDPAQRDMRFLAMWMGPRLVLSQLGYPGQVSAGSESQISSTWRNRGSAPLYRDFRVWYRLRSETGAITNVGSETSLQGLLPTGSDTVAKASKIAIPGSVAAGDYSLDISVAYVDDVGLQIPIAVENVREDGWYEMGPITVAGSGETKLSGLAASAPVNEQDAARIVDGDLNSQWANDGTAATANFSIDLGVVSDVSRIRYLDDYSRNLRISLDGVEVFAGWTAPAGDGFAEIPLEATTAGRVLRFVYPDGTWLAPREVEVFGSVSEAASSRLIDMHNGFLLGQSHVWSPVNQNQGSLDPADQLVQTFRFTAAAAAGSTEASFAAVSAATELDVNELVVYQGSNGQHLVSKVIAVVGDTATFSPALQVTQQANAEFWSLYGDGAHPNKKGYEALGDFVLGQFNAPEIDAMAGKKHLFLGDSWMRPGSANDGRLGDRITSLLGGPAAVETTNRGVGRRTSQDIKEALNADFVAAGGTPDYVWLIVGTNDYFQRVTPERFAANVAEIVDYIEDKGAVAIVLNSSVGQLDATLGDAEEFLKLSQRYVVAERQMFDGR